MPKISTCLVSLFPIILFSANVNCLSCIFCRKILNDVVEECEIKKFAPNTNFCYINDTGCFFAREDYYSFYHCFVMDVIVVCTGFRSVPLLTCDSDNVFFNKGSTYFLQKYLICVFSLFKAILN